MTMIEQRKRPLEEPSVALHLEQDGLTLDVSAQMKEGMLLMSPDQAGDWFKQQWADARLALQTHTLVRLMQGEGGQQLVRHGEAAWGVAETVSISALQPPQPAAPVVNVTVSTPVPEAPATTETSEVADPETPAPTRDEKRSDAQAEILQLVTGAGRKGKTISQLKADTGLNDYQTRTALKKLRDDKLINEKVKGRTATYTVR